MKHSLKIFLPRILIVFIATVCSVVYTFAQTGYKPVVLPSPWSCLGSTYVQEGIDIDTISEGYIHEYLFSDSEIRLTYLMPRIFAKTFDSVLAGNAAYDKEEYFNAAALYYIALMKSKSLNLKFKPTRRYALGNYDSIIKIEVYAQPDSMYNMVQMGLIALEIRESNDPLFLGVPGSGELDLLVPSCVQLTANIFERKNQTERVVIEASNRSLAFSNYSGPYAIADLQGRVIYQGNATGERMELPMQPGVYVARTNDGVQKVIVR
jgi:hypothetical protein